MECCANTLGMCSKNVARVSRNNNVFSSVATWQEKFMFARLPAARCDGCPPPLAPAFSAHDNSASLFFFPFLSLINMYDVVRVAVISTARFLTGSLQLPGGLLLFIGPGNNAVSAYFEAFELPSTRSHPSHLPLLLHHHRLLHRPNVSTTLIDARDPRSRFHLLREGRKNTGGFMSPMYAPQ